MPNPTPLAFDSTDRLGLKPFCERLENYLIVEHDYVDEGLVIGLNAGFGVGKTTFLRMWESDLLARRKGGQFVPMPLVLNAWESDYCGDPLMAILASLVDAVDEWDDSVSAEKKAAFKEAAKDVGWFVTGLANEFVAKHTGINIIAAGGFAEDKRDDRQEKTPDFIELYRGRTAALKNLKERLVSLFGGDVPKVFVFVDELDRCRPDYAVSYLETIKHVFDVRGMVFVLAIDHAHLENSAKALFGQDLNFDEYFRKFCHRVIDLPKPDENGLARLTSDYVKKYLEVADKRICGIDLKNRSEQFVELAKGLAMTPRQLQEAFRIVGHASSMSDPDKRGKIYWCIAAMTILLVFLKMNRQDDYLRIKKGTMPLDEFGILLKSIVERERAEWWLCIYLTGLGVNHSTAPNLTTILTNLEFTVSENDLAQFASGWSQFHNTTRLSEILRRIETADTF
jgi:hypothetical protein